MSLILPPVGFEPRTSLSSVKGPNHLAMGVLLSCVFVILLLVFYLLVLSDIFFFYFLTMLTQNTHYLKA